MNSDAVHCIVWECEKFVELSQAMWQCISPVPEDTQLYSYIAFTFWHHSPFGVCVSFGERREKETNRIRPVSSVPFSLTLSLCTVDSRIVVHLYNDDIAKIEMSSEENVTKRDEIIKKTRRRRRHEDTNNREYEMKRLKDKANATRAWILNIVKMRKGKIRPL